MKFYDISMPLHPAMVVWDDERKFRRREMKFGDAIVSELAMSTHMSTHIDAPKHFLGGKAGTVDKIALGKLIGPCRVIEVQELGIRNLELGAKRGERILLKTKNSSRRLLQKSRFVTDYESVDLATAKYLAAKKIALLGVDYLGVEQKSAPGHLVHKALLAARIVIVEGLDLTQVKPGKYNLAVLPLRIQDGDGAPARAVLWR